MSSSTPSPHRIHRHPAAPWAALRVSVGTQDCYRPHSHPEYSVGIVDEGGATFNHPSGPQPVQAGSVVLIEPQVVHACNPAAGQPWSYRMLFVDAAWLHAAVAGVWGLAQIPQGLHFTSRCVDDAALWAAVDRLCQPIRDAATAQALAEALPSCRVLIVTTFGRPGFLRRALKAGASGFVVKDTPAAQLADAVRRVHAGLRVVDPALATDSLVSGESPLSPRERQLLSALSEGSTRTELAVEWGISVGTIHNHIRVIHAKLAARTTEQALASAGFL